MVTDKFLWFGRLQAKLRVSGLKGPLNEKTREVKAANARAASTLDKAQFEIAQNEILTLDMLYSQASANLQVQQNLDAAKQRVKELQDQVKGLNEKLDNLKEAESKAASLEATVKRLRGRLSNQENQLRTKYRSLMEEEKQALVKQMMDDNEVIMRAAWAAAQPSADYQTWKVQFDKANDEFNARLLREAQEAAEKDAAAKIASGESSSSGGSSFGDEEEDDQEEGEENREHAPEDKADANAEKLP